MVPNKDTISPLHLVAWHSVVTKAMAVRPRLSSSPKLKAPRAGASRLRAMASRLRAGVSRLRAMASRYRAGASRLRAMASRHRAGANRLRLKAGAARLGTVKLDMAARPATSTAGASRLRAMASRLRDGANRLRLRAGAARLMAKAGANRLRLKAGAARLMAKAGANRFRLRAGASRLRLKAGATRLGTVKLDTAAEVMAPVREVTVPVKEVMAADIEVKHPAEEATNQDLNLHVKPTNTVADPLSLGLMVQNLMTPEDLALVDLVSDQAVLDQADQADHADHADHVSAQASVDHALEEAATIQDLDPPTVVTIAHSARQQPLLLDLSQLQNRKLR